MSPYWHDGTKQYGGHDPQENQVVREPNDKKGCLKLLVLPFLGIVWYAYQILYG